MPSLGTIGMTVALLAFAGVLSRRLTDRQADGLLGVGNGLCGWDAIRSGVWPVALVNGAVCAVCLWRWWSGGGGDGTRRRLRRLARRFQGVRRTAPATA
ncbi:hypothetical protein [Streptomyces antibioticus]|uniref:hypothetical protein n=1 Tax=Streptomyces antibioticus TaxID=1890 RepID=UPI0036A0AB4F